MVISEIELFEILSQQLGRDKAKSLVQYVETKIDKRLDEKTNVFSTKEDLAKLEGKLESKIADTKSEIVKWMFIFWIGQLASFIAIAKFIFHQ